MNGTTLITHTVTSAEAGLTILTDPFSAQDIDSSSGGTTVLGCLLTINGASVGGVDVVLRDTGNGVLDTQSAMNLNRLTLATGDVVGVFCATSPEDSGEAIVLAKLLLEHVAS